MSQALDIISQHSRFYKVILVHIVSFVAASSNSGKTTLIEKVVQILKARSLRVAVIKHASAGFDLDKPGKDSWRFQQAGADAVVLVGPDRMALMKKIKQEPSPQELEKMVPDADIVIHEGFKKAAVNKIEVFRHGISGDQPLCMNDASYLALVSDKPFDVSIPRFDLNDANGVAEFLIKKIGTK
jgi:molybdopterin-guanine dinucleotide biosynthesis protein B